MAQELVIASKHVYVSETQPDVAAGLVIEGGRVSYLVPYEEARALPGAVDYGDLFVCPGFHDAHQHVFQSALFPSDLGCSCPGTSEADCVRQMLEFAAAHPGGGWLVGQGWRSALWDPPVPPTRASLDEAFPSRPVAMYSGDCHTLWLNSCGLEALGIDDDTVPPEGGSFDRDERGRLTGVLREAAGMVYVAKVFAALPRDGVKRAYLAYFEKLLAQGITSVCDMALAALPGADGINEDLYEGLLAEKRLPLRVHMFPQLIDDLSRIEGLQARLVGDMLRAPGVKQFFDGVSSAHTAWLGDPYANPYFEGDCGRPTVAPERMCELVMNAAAHRIAVRIHTIGDRAIREAICIYAQAQERYGLPEQGANTLEHLENMLEPDIAAMARAGIVASAQPQHIVIDIEQPARDLGPKRAQLMWPFASFARAGVELALGTDAPCVEPDSMRALSCAVTRTDPQTGAPRGGWLPSERIGMARAIAAYTHGSACAVGRAHELGRLEPGYLADIAVLDHNIMEVDAMGGADAPTDEVNALLVRTRCVATYVGGVLHQKI